MEIYKIIFFAPVLNDNVIWFRNTKQELLSGLNFLQDMNIIPVVKKITEKEFDEHLRAGKQKSN
ncbi:MAG: hypothetical protein SV062_07460 [Thermodesulfobacteriota bacterium]|nr:hypothetical protein [Thermodesulfobacteriota bacterium]